VALVSILFGAAVTLLSAFAIGGLTARRLPPEIRLALGSVMLSFAIFLLMLLHLATWPAFLALAAVALQMAIFLPRLLRPRARRIRDRTPIPRLPRGPMILSLVLLPYLIWYLVNALAPETVADGVTYHLGLPASYLRSGGFPDRITFYGLIPQGMEMLYTMAFAFGRHSAAKLIEFAFFAATLPLVWRVGRALGLTDLACLVAAVLYFCAPVSGITGSSSYNDAAGVFFLLAAIYVVLHRPDAPPWIAGALAGFCYAIKIPGLVAPVAVLLFAGRNRKTVLWIALGATAVIAPWMIRNALLTGNPVAPLMNSLFPNPYFHPATEAELAAGLRSLGPVTPAQVPWELAFGDQLTGTFGPLFFALPVGLLALGRKQGRRLWAAALMLGLAWLTNTGARFLMPSVMLASLTLGMSLARPAACAAIAIQAVLCWPHVIDTWEKRYAFRLHEFPLAAALRIESEPDYLRHHLNEYGVAKMIEQSTPPNSRTLALVSVASAYLDRDVEVTWHSAQADSLLDTLRLAGLYTGTAVFDWKAEWPEQPLGAVRFRIPITYDGEWDISEVQFFSGQYRVSNSPRWTLSGWPNHWEGPLAFDGNLATRWRTWQPVRAGMFFEVDLENPQRLTSAVLVSHTPLYHVPLEVYGRAPRGAWHLLSSAAQALQRPRQDLRLAVGGALRRAGFQYLLASTGSEGNAPIGNLLVGREGEWGLERVGYAGDFHLFRVK
jgi:hypothetical protein